MGGTVAVLLALIGVFLVYTYAQSANVRAMQNLEPTEVLVVRDKVSAGTTVEDLAKLVEVESQPSGVVAESAVENLQDFSGMVTAVELVPGEQLLEERLVDPEELQTPGSVPVPAGLQEVTFLLEPQRVVGGRVTAGDTIGLFASFEGEDPQPSLTQRVFHKVLVTGVQRAETTPEASQEADPEALPEGSMMVTVAVNDVDAARIIFASEFGRIWLTKEPAEATESAPTPIRRAEVFP
ncbi:Flp pilus assembly protein CpaB [Arthrobacter sp. TMN-37]